MGTSLAAGPRRDYVYAESFAMFFAIGSMWACVLWLTGCLLCALVHYFARARRPRLFQGRAAMLIRGGLERMMRASSPAEFLGEHLGNATQVPSRMLPSGQTLLLFDVGIFTPLMEKPEFRVGVGALAGTSHHHLA